MNGAQFKDIILKSEGNQFFSFCFVTDAIDAIIFLLFYGKSKEAYNVSGLQSDVTLKELAECVASLSGTNVKMSSPDVFGEDGYSKSFKALLNLNKINSLGWKPQYSLEYGLSRTIRCIRNQLNTH